jgi:hypothetical protein
MKRYLLLMLSAAAVVVLPSCTTTGAAGGMDNGPAVQVRNAAIAGEPRGDWYVGRRYFTEKCRYWGYLRKPGAPRGALSELSRRFCPAGIKG